MGYYIEVPKNTRKADQIVSLYGGKKVPYPPRFSDIPADSALVIVVNNGPFEAAAYIYSESEWNAFMDPFDGRPKEFVLMKKDVAETLSGYRR